MPTFNKMVRKLPTSFIMLWTMLAILGMSGVLPGCQSTASKQVKAPDLNTPISQVGTTVTTIANQAKQIHSLAERVVGDANTTVKFLITENAAGIEDNSKKAYEQINAVVAVNQVLLTKFDEQNTNIKSLELESKHKGDRIAELEHQWWSPRQIKLFWIAVISYSIGSIALAVLSGYNVGGSTVQWAVKEVIRFLPFMNPVSWIRNWIQKKPMSA